MVRMGIFQSGQKSPVIFPAPKGPTSCSLTPKCYTLTPIPLGKEVLLQDQKSKRWDRTGVIIGIGACRDYKIKTDSGGGITWRNRRFLKPLKPDQT